MQNPLIEFAAKDRHTGYNYYCVDCGSSVSTYNCNEFLYAARPELVNDPWDWWIACDNAACIHAYGEGFWQDKPEWMIRK